MLSRKLREAGNILQNTKKKDLSLLTSLFLIDGGPSATRTRDQWIKSPLLYQLS